MPGRDTLKEILRTAAVFLAACLALLVVRQFVAAQYTMPRDTAAGGMLPGDHVLVSKTAYGARLPFPELTDCRRIGYRRPGRGDIVAFNLPTDTLRPIPSRKVCMALSLALPGDTVWLSPKMAVSAKPAKGSLPFVVPGRGARVAVTSWNARLLCNTVNLHEPCHTAAMRGDTLLIDGHAATYVAFTQDYFWMYSGRQGDLGDSRAYGLVPQSHLVGKGVMILFSTRPFAPLNHSLRAGRFLKSLP